jgi:hypothetical protein
MLLGQPGDGRANHAQYRECIEVSFHWCELGRGFEKLPRLEAIKHGLRVRGHAQEREATAQSPHCGNESFFPNGNSRADEKAERENQTADEYGPQSAIRWHVPTNALLQRNRRIHATGGSIIKPARCHRLHLRIKLDDLFAVRAEITELRAA